MIISIAADTSDDSDSFHNPNYHVTFTGLWSPTTNHNNNSSAAVVEWIWLHVVLLVLCNGADTDSYPPLTVTAVATYHNNSNC